MSSYLQVLSGKNNGAKFEFHAPISRMGRHPDCEIHIDLGAVSRVHAQVVQEDGKSFIEDLQSRNGTFVNGKKIQERTLLADNDRVKICDTLLVYKDPSAASNAMPANLAVGDSDATVLTAFDALTDADMMVKVKPEAKLRAILEITQTIGNTLDIDQTYSKILESLFSIFPQADRALILLHDKSKNLVPKAVKHRHEEEDTVRYSRTIVGSAMTEKKAILSADAASDTRFSMAESIADFSIRSIMCVPLLSQQESDAMGVIQLDTQNQGQRFSEDDLQILASVATPGSDIDRKLPNARSDVD